MEWCELDRIPVYLSDVQILAYFLDFGGRDVVCGAPDAFGGLVLFLLVLNLHDEAHLDIQPQAEEIEYSEQLLTVSVKVSQCALSINVTTRPGASGVPR